MLTMYSPQTIFVCYTRWNLQNQSLYWLLLIQILKSDLRVNILPEPFTSELFRIPVPRHKTEMYGQKYFQFQLKLITHQPSKR